MNTPDRDFVIAELERMIGDSLVGRAAIALISAQAPKPASAGGERIRLPERRSPDGLSTKGQTQFDNGWNCALCEVEMLNAGRIAGRSIIEQSIAAEADTAKVRKVRPGWESRIAEPPTPAADRLAPIEARGAVTVDMASLFAPERMPARDEDGNAWHPDLSLRCLYDFDPDDEAPLSKECLASLGWECRITSFDHDDAEDDDDPGDTYYRAGIAWQPEPPGPEWRLVCTSQDEDGDWNAWWVRRIAETLSARESAPAVEPYAAKGILLALALCGAMGSARADSLRVDAAGIGVKYEGAVAAILEPTATSPAVLVFQQGSGLPIGGGPQLPPRPGSVPFVLEFSRPDGSGVALACVGPPPAFDGAEFHAHFVCKAQPE